MHERSLAFTLIELLVVVSVIVLLMALLAPALDRAIYQAELTVCGARQGSLARIVVSYTAGFKRAYPRGATDRTGAHQNLVLSLTDEIRPVFRSFFPLNAYLNCPLNEDIDLDGAHFDAPVPLTAIFSDYSFFFGWRWSGFRATEEGMDRLGDRFSWTDGSRRVWRFNLLSSDWNEDNLGGNPFVASTHPDDRAMMRSIRTQDFEAHWTGGASQRVTLSWWENTGSDERGVIDRNFAYDDGSVQRVLRQPWGDGSTRGPGDTRFLAVPQVASAEHMNNHYPTRKIYLPK